MDTVHLHLENFSVADENGLKVTSNFDPSTGETTDGPLYATGDGRPPVEGRHANLDAPLFWARLLGPTSLLVHINLPKVLSEDNVWPVHMRTDLALALDAVEQALSNEGIETKVRDAYLTRVDLCRNVVLGEKVQEYEPVFRSLDFPRMDRKRYEDDGYRWENGSREVVHYDKGLEQTGQSSKTLRAEYRVKGGKANVEALLGIETVEGLFDHLNGVKESFFEVHERLLPEENRGTEEIPRGTGGGFEAVMRALENEAGAYRRALEAYAYSQMSGSERDAFLEVTGQVLNRQKKSRAKQNMDDLRALASYFEEGKVSEAEMWRELRQEVLSGSPQPHCSDPAA